MASLVLTVLSLAVLALCARYVVLYIRLKPRVQLIGQATVNLTEVIRLYIQDRGCMPSGMDDLESAGPALHQACGGLDGLTSSAQEEAAVQMRRQCLDQALGRLDAVGVGTLVVVE